MADTTAPDPSRVESLLIQCWQVLVDVFLPKVPEVFHEALSQAVRSGDEAQARPALALSMQEKTLVRAFGQELRGGFDAGVALFLGRKAVAGARRPALSLMDMDESDLRSQIDQCAARLRNLVQHGNSSVSLRLQSLRGGGDFSDLQSPLRPAIFLEAVADALGAANPPVEGTSVLLRHFAAPLSGPLEAAYAAISRLLDGKGVAPYSASRVAADPDRFTLEGDTPAKVPTVAEGPSAAGVASARNNPAVADGAATAVVASRGNPARAAAAAPILPGEDEPLLEYGRLQAAHGVNAAPLVEAVLDAARRVAAGQALTQVAPASELMAAMLAAQRQDAARVAAKGVAESGSPVTTEGKPLPEYVGSREHSRRLITLASTPLHKLTIQLVARIFARIERDRLVPPPLRTLVLCLRFPFLELALADPSVLVRADHPARRLINALASSSIGWSADGADNQRYLHQARSAVHFVVHSPSAAGSAFAQSCDQFDAFLASVVPATSESLAAAREILREAERREIQALEASRFLDEVVENAGLEPYLRQFILGPWARAMVEGSALGGPAQFRRLLMVVPELVASVMPAAAANDRKRQVESIAALLTNLRDGMALIGWPAEKMQAFLNRLMIAHSHILTGGETPAPTGGGFSPSTVRIRLDGFTLRAGPDVDPEQPPPVVEEAVQHLLAQAKSPVVHQWLKAPPKLAADAPGPEEARALVAHWRERRWFDISVGRALVRMRLVGWTPGRAIALFSSRTGGSLASLSHDTLVDYVRGGLIRPAETAPLLSRALRSVLKDLHRAVEVARDGTPDGA